jgi:hypothetical protein
MTTLQSQPTPSGGSERATLLPALRAGTVATGASGRPPRRKIGFGRVRVSDWGHRPFRVY